MNVNDLRTPIEIWEYVRTDNSGGTPIENFLLYRTKYSLMRVKGGATLNNELGNLPYTNVEFTIRYDENVNYQCQIKYNTKMYKIEHIEILERKAWMRIQTIVYNELM